MDETVQSPQDKETSITPNMWERLFKGVFKVLIKIAILRNVLYYEQSINSN